MPSVTKLIRLGTLPETRRAIVAAWRSGRVRDLARRARSDRAGLLRDLARPATALGLAWDAVQHPATRELASVGSVFLPGRFLPLGWVAMWLARRVSGRLADGSGQRARSGTPPSASRTGGRAWGSPPVRPDPEGGHAQPRRGH